MVLKDDMENYIYYTTMVKQRLKLMWYHTGLIVNLIVKDKALQRFLDQLQKNDGDKKSFKKF
ncbi:hypothetical protein G9C98_003120 [Cotesia typhae]|uniref:Uncharacterized protein n=1 Tax=Cotesia typhae TaxID=2053667 RepID=A0A8J5R525_9HYME|nr:hypothetical protein G9C98_003120 [Cotesia typhae]